MSTGLRPNGSVDRIWCDLRPCPNGLVVMGEIPHDGIAAALISSLTPNRVRENLTANGWACFPDHDLDFCPRCALRLN
ncbi:MAG: hypothetical protein R3246_13235 [Acidimicrobiia bacterium]|nr:hypothetical protein [Acidimicrobiia bacterium]